MKNLPEPSVNIQQAVIAVNRFGLGAKPGELIQATSDPKNWLKTSLSPIVYSSSLPASGEIQQKLVEYREQEKKFEKESSKKKAPAMDEAMNMAPEMDDESSKMMKEMKKYPQEVYRNYIIDSAQQAIAADNSITWRLLDFFSNHFSVTAAGQVMAALAPTLEREAIAPHVLGKFDEMLLAVVKHPAMLIYLNNEKSFGPNSKMGKKGKGLNENLAREILELHTLGVNGGYSQNDVIELAKGITGWTVNNPKKDKDTGFKFNPAGHEPGTRTLLGKTYKQKDIKQGEAMLKDIAAHPSTTKYLCFKLARHFINDKPSASLLAALETTWLKTGGDIKQVMHTLIDSPESWLPQQEKFKTPRDFIFSTLRALQLKQMKAKHLLYSFISLGQKPFNAGSPAGYGDEHTDWDGGSALMARIDWVNSISPMSKVNAEQVMLNSFSASLSQHSYQIISRAESRKLALTLVLMSPEFQRR